MMEACEAQYRAIWATRWTYQMCMQDVRVHMRCGTSVYIHLYVYIYIYIYM